jgi:hypothetical protein
MTLWKRKVDGSVFYIDAGVTMQVFRDSGFEQIRA